MTTKTMTTKTDNDNKDNKNEAHKNEDNYNESYLIGNTIPIVISGNCCTLSSSLVAGFFRLEWVVQVSVSLEARLPKPPDTVLIQEEQNWLLSSSQVTSSAVSLSAAPHLSSAVSLSAGLLLSSCQLTSVLVSLPRSWSAGTFQWRKLMPRFLRRIYVGGMIQIFCHFSAESTHHSRAESAVWSKFLFSWRKTILGATGESHV